MKFMTKVISTTGIALTPVLRLGLGQIDEFYGFSPEPVLSIPN